MLPRHHWFKRDVVFPVISLTLAGFVLAWLGQQLTPILESLDADWLRWTYWSSIAVFLIFAYVTLRHVLSTYTLERFDPGDPESVRRLSHIGRFNYVPPEKSVTAYRETLEQAFLAEGFVLEADHPVVGHVLFRSTPSIWPLMPPRQERIFLVEKTPINVFIVDFTIRDALDYLIDLDGRVSDRKTLLFMTKEQQILEAASAAAGVVNFLGKTEVGTLGTMLLDGYNNRLYYPIDQTMLSYAQRKYLRKMRRKIILALSPADSV